MKRTSLSNLRTRLRRSGPLKAKTPMKQVSAKKKAYYASAEGKLAYKHMGRVKMLPCAVCGAPPPSDCHHVCHDRYSSKKSSDFDTIPLCKAHHQDGPLAIHNAKKSWRKEYGADWTYLPWVKKMLSYSCPEDGGL